MDVADKIADVILTDPSVSVREIAQRLGYAEERTIYYWINKRGFHGIRPFKRAVLTGQFRGQLHARESTARPGRLPVADRLTKTGDPVYTGETVPITLDRGRGLYVWRYQGDPEIGILPLDLLVIGPVDLDSAELVLAQSAAGTVVLRHVITVDHTRLLVGYAPAQVDRTCRPVGTVLQVARLLRPATL